MPEELSPGYEQAFGALRQFVRARRASSPAVERCELCSAGLAAEHSHLVEVANRRIVCACEACAILFDGKTGSRYKRVPRRIGRLADFQLTDGSWESLLIPINMAFFFYSSIEGRIAALYPSPAGAVESLLPLEAWEEIVRENPVLRGMEPDVEALLVNRVGHAQGSHPSEYYLAPIDQCYRLVGLIRSHWRGLSGGAEVWTEIGQFFSDLRAKADVIRGEHHA